MGDSWEDDDFEVPVVPQPILPKKDAWDDEEEDDPNDGKTPEQLAAEQEKRKKAEAARLLKEAKEAEKAERLRSIEAEEAKLAAMTPQERAIYQREREEREAEGMAAELFGVNGSGKGSGATTPTATIKTPKSGGGSKVSAATDLGALGKDLSVQLKKAKAEIVVNFLQEVLKGAKEPMSVEDVEDLMSRLQVIRDEKHRLAEAQRNKLSVKEKKLAQKKKEHKQKSVHTAEVFGGDYEDHDEYMDDRYLSIEEDFM